MFSAMLRVQWKWSRWSVLLLMFAVAAVTIWSMSADQHSQVTGMGTSELFNHMATASKWYGFVAVVAGFLLAMHAWRADHMGRHVYALSLPIARWRFALYRYAAGALFSVLILGALWVAAVGAVTVKGVPEGLHAYPTGLAMRVGMVLFTAYAVFFAIWSNTARAGYYIAGAIVTIFLGIAVTSSLNSLLLVNALESLWKYSGLREIVGGRWFLIDV